MKCINYFLLILVLVLSAIAFPSQAEISSHTMQACMEAIVTTQKESGFISRWQEEDKLAFTSIVNEHVSLTQEQTEIFQEKLEDPYFSLFYLNELAYGHCFFWTIEQKAWFDEVLVALGLMERAVNILPSENEITPKQAVALAEQELASSFSIDPNELTAYKKSIQYLDHQDGNGPYYKVEFIGETETIFADYIAYIYDAGTIVQVVNNIPSTLEESYGDMITQKGPFRFWSINDKYDFMLVLPEKIYQAELAGQIVPEHLYDMLNNQYGLPKPGDVPENDIIAFAKAHLLASANATEDFTKMKIATYYRVDDPENPKWEIAFYDVKHLYTVNLSATGDILEISYDYRNTTHHAPLASTAYETKLYQQKPDNRLWSIEERATLMNLQIEEGSIFTLLDTLPTENEITEVNALASAQKELMDSGLLTANEACIVSVHFYEYVKTNIRCWFFGFHIENEESIYVSIDSNTGEVIQVKTEPNG